MRVGGRYQHGDSDVNPGGGMSFGNVVSVGMICVMAHQRDGRKTGARPVTNTGSPTGARLLGSLVG